MSALTPERECGAAAASRSERDYAALAARIAEWGSELGFDAIGVSDTDLTSEEVRLLNWLALGRHGEMDYMARHGTRRARAAELVPGTIRVITARLNYWPDRAEAPDRKSVV